MPRFAAVAVSTLAATAAFAGALGGCGHDCGGRGCGAPVTQSDLLADVERVQAYGRGHAEVWAGVEFDVVDDEDVIVAWFTEDLERHAAELSALVDHPASIRTRRAHHTLLELERVKDDVMRELAGIPGVAVSIGRDQVVAHVPTEHADLAAALEARQPLLVVRLGSGVATVSAGPKA